MKFKFRKELRRGTQKSPSSQARWIGSEIGSQIKTIFTLVLVVGGLMTLQLFVSLKHMPDLDLAGSAALLAAVSVLGLMIFFFLGSTGLVPALIASGMLSSRLPAKLRAEYVAWSSVPALLFVLLIVLQYSRWGQVAWPDWLRISSDQILFELISWSLLLACCLALHSVKRTNSGKRSWWTGADVLFEFWWLGSIWVLTLSLSLEWLINLRDPGEKSEWPVYRAMAIWCVLQVIQNAVVTHFGTTKAMVRGVIFAVLSMIFVLCMLGNFSAVALATFRALGIANIPVRLTVTREGCEILNAGMRNGAVCTMLSDQKYGIVCPVILSRVGSPNLIQFAPIDPDGNTWPSASGKTSLPLAREHVLTWLLLNTSRPANAREISANATSTILSAARMSETSPAEQAWLTQLCDSSPPAGLIGRQTQ
ncbi:hypothetical protein WKW80_06255 [Variovorax humicola]|uniref:Uncharacterized protein n=1 Tax=Variovorax humicola TaxID=1769758 RepID=A0ABU8VVL6_9BURK